MDGRCTRRTTDLRPGRALMLAGALLLMPMTAGAQSPTVTSSPASPEAGASAAPPASAAPCPAMTAARLPLDDPSARLVAAFGGPATGDASPDPSAGTRYQAGDDWDVPPTETGATVHPIGPGRILAAGPLEAPTGTGIVVVSHVGSLLIPESPPGSAYAYPEQQVDSILSVYEGLVVSPELVVGACVDADATLGVSGATCIDVAGASSCVTAPPPLHLELRLADTADPASRSADWVRVGPPGDSVDGAFLDPQAMADDGLRDPAAFIAAFVAVSPSPGGSPTASVAPSPVASSAPGSARRPNAPSNVKFRVHTRPWTGDTQPDYRLEVTWDAPSDADTTIEVYGVMTCPRKPTEAGRYCLTRKTRLPSSILELQAQAPAADHSVSWLAQGWEEIGGPIGLDKDGNDVWGIVVRAVDSHGASRFVIAKGGNGWSCSGCVY